MGFFSFDNLSILGAILKVIQLILLFLPIFKPSIFFNYEERFPRFQSFDDMLSEKGWNYGVGIYVFLGARLLLYYVLIGVIGELVITTLFTA